MNCMIDKQNVGEMHSFASSRTYNYCMVCSIISFFGIFSFLPTFRGHTLQFALFLSWGFEYEKPNTHFSWKISDAFV